MSLYTALWSSPLQTEKIKEEGNLNCLRKCLNENQAEVMENLVCKLKNREKHWQNVILGPNMKDFICHAVGFCFVNNER